MLEAGGKQHLSSFLPCQDNAGLQIFLGKLWGLWCRKGERERVPQIQTYSNTSWRLLSFPCPFPNTDHLEDSVLLPWQRSQVLTISVTNTEQGRPLVRPSRSTSLCFGIRLYFWERKRTEGERNNKSSFALRCAHVFSDGYLIISSSISPLSPFSNNSNKCQIRSQLMKCTPIKWPKWKNGPPWLPALRPSCNACNQMILPGLRKFLVK